MQQLPRVACCPFRQSTVKNGRVPPQQNYCEGGEILPEGQCGSCPARSTVDMLFVVLRPQERGRARQIPPYMRFIDLQKACDYVDRELLWVVLARSGVLDNFLTVICQFHEGTRARVRTDDGEHSEWFDITQGLRQGCVLSPLLFKIFFAAVTRRGRTLQ